MHNSLIRNTILVVISLFVANFAQAQAESPYNLLIPKPHVVEQDFLVDNFVISPQSTIVCENSFLANYLCDRIANATGYRVNIIKKGKLKRKEKNCILITTNKKDLGDKFGEESYSLKINSERIEIIGADYGGMFYGIQTLLQLLPPEVYNFDNKEFTDTLLVPAGKIVDYPKYSYRGFMLDVSRTWRPKEVIYKVLENLAYHKINKFHWHLADDEGWRVEIKSLPELTEKAAWRGPGEVRSAVWGSGNKRYGGYYTQEEIKEIVKFASDRNIEIIPEIDMPGHSQALTLTYPDVVCSQPETDTTTYRSDHSRNIWCVSKESNYEMLDKIIGEMAQIFPSEYFNIGGDEVNHTNWKQCPDCQALEKELGLSDEYELHNYFVTRLDAIAHKHGKKIAGWEELMAAGEIDSEALISIWRNPEYAQKAIKEHHYCVIELAPYLYLDMKQSEKERGHDWAGIVPLEKTYSLVPEAVAMPQDSSLSSEVKSAAVKKYLKGVQGNLWEELGNRPDNFVDYQMFPRVCAVAEIGWGTTGGSLSSSPNYENFYHRLTTAHYARMSNMQIKFRVPPPKVSASSITKFYSGVPRTRNEYTITVEPPFEGALIKYAITSPTAPCDGLLGQLDTNIYSNIYTQPLVTEDISKYRFATFVSDTLHSIGVAVDNLPLHEYLHPSFTLESNMVLSDNSSIENISDWNPKTIAFFNGPAKEGDYWIITFDEPLSCSIIDIYSGRPWLGINIITDGYIEYSYDGETYIRGGDFDCGRAVATPNKERAVKSFRIVVTAPSDSELVGIADPVIY